MPLGKEPLDSKTVHLRIKCFAIYLNAGEIRPGHRGDDDEDDDEIFAILLAQDSHPTCWYVIKRDETRRNETRRFLRFIVSQTDVAHRHVTRETRHWTGHGEQPRTAEPAERGVSE